MTPNPYCQVKGFLPAWEEAAGSPLGPLRVSHLPPLQEEAVVPTLQDAWISTQHRVAGAALGLGEDGTTQGPSITLDQGCPV